MQTKPNQKHHHKQQQKIQEQETFVLICQTFSMTSILGKFLYGGIHYCLTLMDKIYAVLHMTPPGVSSKLCSQANILLNKESVFPPPLSVMHQ